MAYGEPPAVRCGGDLGGEGVGAGGAQPGPRPAVDVAVGGAGEGVDEVGEGGVAEAVAGEVVVDAGQEVLLAEPGDELAQGGGALGVRDAVEVEQRGGGVGDGGRVGGDGVGGGALVGVVAPALAGDGEVGPGVGPGGGLGQDLEAHVLGEGLVQPDVVPPLEGDEVAEPHVGHLVGDDHAAGLALGVGDGGAEDEVVAEGDQAGVLHRARVELGDECLVVGVERIRLLEDLVVAVEAAAGGGQQLALVGVQVGRQRAAAVQAEGQAGVLAAYGVPGAGGDGEQVGADRRGRRDPPAAFPSSVSVHALGDAVAQDGPGWRRGDRDLEDGFQVRLVEGGQHALDVVQEELCVDVGLAVGRVREAVHALAGARVAHVRLDPQLVRAGREAGERQPVVLQRGRVELVAVQHGPVQGRGLELDERVAVGEGGEPDHRA